MLIKAYMLLTNQKAMSGLSSLKFVQYNKMQVKIYFELLFEKKFREALEILAFFRDNAEKFKAAHTSLVTISQISAEKSHTVCPKIF